MNTVEYRGEDYTVVSFGTAMLIYNDRTSKGEHVAIMDASSYGGEHGQYFIVKARMKEVLPDERTEQLED